MRILEYDGQRHSMKEWGRIIGMRPDTIRSRLRRGWSVEKSLTEPLCFPSRCNAKLSLTFNNETRLLWEWSEVLNIPYHVLYSRYASGWSAEDILTRPVRKRRSKYKLCNKDCFNCEYDDCMRR